MLLVDISSGDISFFPPRSVSHQYRQNTTATIFDTIYTRNARLKKKARVRWASGNLLLASRKCAGIRFHVYNIPVHGLMGEGYIPSYMYGTRCLLNILSTVHLRELHLLMLTKHGINGALDSRASMGKYVRWRLSRRTPNGLRFCCWIATLAVTHVY